MRITEQARRKRPRMQCGKKDPKTTTFNLAEQKQGGGRDVQSDVSDSDAPDAKALSTGTPPHKLHEHAGIDQQVRRIISPRSECLLRTPYWTAAIGPVGL